MQIFEEGIVDKLVVITQEVLGNMAGDGINAQRIKDCLEKVASTFFGEVGKEIKDRAFEILVNRYSSFTRESSILVSDANVSPWVDDEVKNNRILWKLYDQLLKKKGWSPDALTELDRSTDKILNQIGNPNRDTSWAIKGMVVGRIQSGKTANYIGLTNKAIDAGYKIVIVLAGMYNNLRSQTQIRFDEGLLGRTAAEYEVDMEFVGVGLLDKTQRVISLTNRMENGDFSKAKAKTVINIGPEEKPWIFVVKKNATVLRLLRQWIQSRLKHNNETHSNLPLLMIDDEADNASIDTRYMQEDEDGRPSEDHDPTRINNEIRRILQLFNRSSYVGYTATPFANVFIDPEGWTNEAGSDLYPSNFILTLNAPDQHLDAEKLFGLGDEVSKELPLTRAVTDADSWIPKKHKKSHIPRIGGQEIIPASLEEAILSFFLSTAVREIRGDGAKHCSMLIHVTRFQDVQDRVAQQVNEYVRHTNHKLRHHTMEDHKQLKDKFKSIWFDPMDGFVVTTKRIQDSSFKNLAGELPSFDEVFKLLPDIVSQIEVKEINGSAKDVLDYSNGSQKVIVIGGDKLSRGLTLEGLSVSYFTRQAYTYDTLMQMGRWFGYRTGYLDLCRLYLPPILETQYRHIAEATRGMLDQFDYFAENKLSPKEYGIRILNHPSLRITSALKMRTASNLKLRLNGSLYGVFALSRDHYIRDDNFNYLKELLTAMGAPEPIPFYRKKYTEDLQMVKEKQKGIWWKNVDASIVLEFFKKYIYADGSSNKSVIPEFIKRMNEKGELTKWTVAIPGAENNYLDEVLKNGKKMPTTSRKATEDKDEKYGDIFYVKSFFLGHEEAIDLDDNEWKAAMELTLKHKKAMQPSVAAIRRTRDPRRALLLLYVLELKDVPSDGDTPFVTYAISFPDSDNAILTDYVVNKNYLLEEFVS